ncbi:cytochrome P450 [Cryphonectria parasitica EP155]|uniref:Cytochrome P450 n=1 Tax=Cryphonectria parasitica (strain ATCC 38755 / EP155) TaxID=660469 RepID=A0A9P5CPA8_CRYP1|nr:cytochrome P450 [Cryphonectria parasitica EP155]KAF3764976.1 cytochrome P450 [Cryphonectria parasitica EP155]
MSSPSPWQVMTAISAVAGYVATTAFHPQWSTASFVSYFVGSWVVSFFGWAFWKVILWPKVFSPLRDLPEPKNLSWYNGQWAKIKALPNGSPMQEWAATVPHNGVIRYLGLLNQERLLVISPKALAEVLVTKNYEFCKPSSVRFALSRVLGFGILMAEGDEHKTQRRNLMPAFAFRHIKDLYPIFWAKSREGVHAMARQIELDAAQDPSSSKAGFLEISSWASRITLDIIGVAGLGRDFGAIADPTSPLFQTYKTVFKPSRGAQLLNMLGLLLPSWVVSRIPVQRNSDMRGASITIRRTCAELIREKKERMAREKERADVDILSVALESGGFTDENLVDQLMTFLAAGHETTASSTTWAIYLLCRYPEVQARLRREVRERLPGVDGGDAAATISSLDVDRMPYLNAVCSEVLRYYAPVPMTFREAAVDTTIQGHPVPKGTRIVLSASAVNKELALWGPDARQFNPDRWLPKYDGDKGAAAGGATSNYAFMTFLHGPRSCIGSSFARAEFACLLAALVGKMEFELRYPEDGDEDKLEIKSGVTSRPAKGMHVKVRVLDGW